MNDEAQSTISKIVSRIWNAPPVPQPAATHGGSRIKESVPEKPMQFGPVPGSYVGLLGEHIHLSRILNDPARKNKYTRGQLAQISERHRVVRKNLGDIQQLNPPPVITATDMVPIQKSQNELLRRQRWEHMARVDMYVADLLQEHDVLEAIFLEHKEYIMAQEIAKLQTEVDGNATTIANLEAERAELAETAT